MTTTAPAVAETSRIGFPELSIVADGDEYVVGDPTTGQFVSLPPIGVSAIRALSAGQTVGAAAEEVSTEAGEPVNLVEFVDTLIECGLVATIDGVSARPADSTRQPGRWTAIRPEHARLLFGPVAWCCYLVAAVWSTVVLIAAPAYRPAFEDYLFSPNPAASLGFLFVLSIALAIVHEYWHWLAARALGVDATISLSRRAFFVVAQTDLRQLWSLPRRARLGPLAAGMAFDVTVLGIALGLRVAHGHWTVPTPLADRLLAALVLSQIFSIAFQMLICLRTDGYLLLSTMLGCRDLLDTTRLHVRALVWRLTPAQRERLANAPARDRRVAVWFGPVFVIVLAFLGYVFVNYWVPGVIVSTAWIFFGLAGAPIDSTAFVQAAVPATLLVVQLVAPIGIAIRDRRRAGR